MVMTGGGVAHISHFSATAGRITWDDDRHEHMAEPVAVQLPFHVRRDHLIRRDIRPRLLPAHFGADLMKYLSMTRSRRRC